MLICLLLSFPSLTAAQAPPRLRPRIGLALGGGAARGLAHIGVLQWMEEHRVPVDVITGTSMGGLVGGAYAIGMSPADMRALMRATDWDRLLRPDSPFAGKTFRRKQDKRTYPSGLELGLRDGVTLPRAINPGMGVGLLLDRMTLPYYEVERFDDLPTPFRCLALDLRSGQPVVLSEGPLPAAMRATMAIPGLFTPVTLGKWLLVDGGAANNVPGDVARDMGADVVIAVDVSSSRQADATAGLDRADMFTVLNRTLDAMMAAGSRKGLEAANVVVVPDLQGLDGMAFASSDELADRGYRAAAALADRLLPYALGEEEYRAHQAARNARVRRALPVLRDVRVIGVPARDQQALRAVLAGAIGQPADADRIEASINRIAGTDRYESIDYRVAAGPAGLGLLVAVQPKTYGPPFLALGISVNNVDASHVAAYLSARLTTYDTFGAGSEFRNDVAIGTRQGYAGEIFEPIAHSPLFVAPRASFSRDDLAWFSGDEVQGESRVRRAGGGVDVGVTGGRSAEVRVGYDAGYVWGAPLIGAPPVETFEGREAFASLRAVVDRQDDPVVPSRGFAARGEVRRYFSTPAASTGGTPLGNPSRFWQAQASASQFVPVGNGNRLFGQVAAGTSFGAEPLLEEFWLGGPFHLGAFSPYELRGPSYALGVGGYLHRVGRMLGGDVLVGGWYEAGSAFESANDATWRQVVSGGAIVNSFLGPIFAGGSTTFDGHSRLYIAIGTIWK